MESPSCLVKALKGPEKSLNTLRRPGIRILSERRHQAVECFPRLSDPPLTPTGLSAFLGSQAGSPPSDGARVTGLDDAFHLPFQRRDDVLRQAGGMVAEPARHPVLMMKEAQQVLDRGKHHVHTGRIACQAIRDDRLGTVAKPLQGDEKPATRPGRSGVKQGHRHRESGGLVHRHTPIVPDLTNLEPFFIDRQTDRVAPGNDPGMNGGRECDGETGHPVPHRAFGHATPQPDAREGDIPRVSREGEDHHVDVGRQLRDRSLGIQQHGDGISLLTLDRRRLVRDCRSHPECQQGVRHGGGRGGRRLEEGGEGLFQHHVFFGVKRPLLPLRLEHGTNDRAGDLLHCGSNIRRGQIRSSQSGRDQLAELGRGVQRMLTEHLGDGRHHRGIDLTLALKIGQEIPAAVLQLLVKVLRILAGLVAEGLGDVLMREERLPRVWGLKRPQEQTQHLFIGARVGKLKKSLDSSYDTCHPDRQLRDAP